MRLNTIGRTGLLIVAVSGLVAVVLWGLVASALYTDERETIARTNVEGHNLARGLAEHVASSVRVLDLVLINLQEEWLETGESFHEHVARLQENLAREQVSQFIVVNADGRIEYSNRPGLQGVDVSDRPFFKVHKELGRRGLYISAPELDPELKQWTIKFTRPMYDHNGRFAGVLALFLPPPALERIYNDIELGQGSVITLVRADGQILARSQNLAEAAGVSLARAPGLRPNAAPAGSYRHKAVTDGIERLYVYQKVPGYLLTVIVGQSVDTALAPYRAERATYLVAAALATLLLSTVTLLLISRQRNKEQAEQALQAQIAHLQLVYDTSSAAIFEVDSQGMITHANRRMAEMLALSPERLSGSKYPDYLHPDQREAGSETMFALRDSKIANLDQERHYQRGDGSEFWGRITARRMLDARGEVIGLVGVIVDVTQAKLAGEALRRNEAHLREVFDAFPIAIAHIDNTERMTFANRVYRESYDTEYSGRLVREFVGDETYAVLQPHIRRALAGEAVQYERSVVGDGGRVSTRYVRYIPDRDAAGRVSGIFVLREDITARRRAEEKIRKLNEDLERRVHERTTELSAANAALQAEVKERRLAETEALMLADRLKIMALRLGDAQEIERRRLAAELHDGVCSNLAAIGLNLALLHKQLPQGDRAGLQRRLSDLIALIDETKASAKDLTVDLRPLLLEERDLFAALEDYARKFELSTGIAVELKSANCGMRLSPETKIALFRIAQEALTNCAKHAQASVVVIEFDADSENLRLSIADNGIGIDLAAVNGKTRGLGLLSMQERAEAIGGSWEIESTPARGTRVTVRVGAAPV